MQREEREAGGGWVDEVGGEGDRRRDRLMCGEGEVRRDVRRLESWACKSGNVGAYGTFHTHR